MVITEFGKLIRKARLDAEVTLASMAEDLGVTSAFLSSLETGRKRIPDGWPQRVEQYFQNHNMRISGLAEAADIANKNISLDGLAPEHQRLVAGFARMSPNGQQLQRLQELLAQFKDEK
ncbi:helix-turn-helix transcriptional regulator [Chromobacterium violaceum]|uniref:helix-turn-helix domain-containing protein n=1 Tax=Chromobacterium violaceum TaxID=536 RepID=UPI001B344C30|nr:helix-turn-helix transcriptional regulator [Chromobacterium violaceum]MBP4050729.1 helix-turn-helix transcriptional regulator [Chromobacterium violaceum]